MNIVTILSSFDLKIRNGMFRPITRRLHADIADDRSQDALGLVYEQYRRHAEQGEILDDALLVYAARLRAEDLSRQIVPAGGKARKGSVMDLRNFIEGKVEVLRLNQILAHRQRLHVQFPRHAEGAGCVQRDALAWHRLATLDRRDH